MAGNVEKKVGRRINYILSTLSYEDIKECSNHGGSGAEHHKGSKKTSSK
jgi:hypothetical protein